MPASSKYYVFTVNNPTPEEEKALRDTPVGQDDAVTYLIFGREVGESGTPHLQGYLELKTRRAISYVKRIGGLARSHLERRRGSSEEAADYCKKDGDFVEFGVISESNAGKRTDLDLCIESVQSGKSLREIYRDHPSVMVRYSKGIKDLKLNLAPEKEKVVYPLESFAFHPIVLEEGYAYIIWGPSGCGKTSYARSRFPKALMVSHPDDLSRFDPTTHEAIIFDDMSFTHLPRTSQIHLVDWDDDRSIHIRYTTALIPAGTLKIFTSNVRQIFDLDDAAIKRRVKVVHINTLDN